jgi:hypothetical protein
VILHQLRPRLHGASFRQLRRPDISRRAGA